MDEALAPEAGAQVRIGMPSGILTVGAEVEQDGTGQWVAHSGAFYRTAGACSMVASTSRVNRSGRLRAGMNDRANVLATQRRREPARHEPVYNLHALDVAGR